MPRGRRCDSVGYCQITHYVVNYDPAQRGRNELCLKILNGHKPPGTLVPVEKLAAPEILFEIEVMAIMQVDEEG
jgi:monoamine oxidase